MHPNKYCIKVTIQVHFELDITVTGVCMQAYSFKCSSITSNPRVGRKALARLNVYSSDQTQFLEGHSSAQFCSNPNQTHLNQIHWVNQGLQDY